MHRGFSRDVSDAASVERVAAGGRALKLSQDRERAQSAFENRKAKIASDAQRKVRNIDARFQQSSQAEAPTSGRYGLVSAEEFRRAQTAGEDGSGRAAGRGPTTATKRIDKRARKRKRAVLSFAEDDEDESSARVKEAVDAAEAADAGTADAGTADAAEVQAPPPAGGDGAGGRKDPTVDTSFLPDRERERLLAEQRAELKREWLAEQERVKGESLEITYSYWDGTGHRRTIVVPKGTTTGTFLEKVRQQLLPEFKALRSVSPEELLYVKEDLMIPHHISFYDLIVTKARGKSGPLFHFDVHDDVRLVQDVRVEKDESHPGKVVERSWYERNKHLFPASRWAMYDPNVQRTERYTIHGD